MPKIEADERLLKSLLNDKYDNQKLEDSLVVAKAELDGYDEIEKVYKIGLNDTNRPDLWSPAGVARQLNTYKSENIPSYDFFSTIGENKDYEDRILIVDQSAKEIRPYSVGFAVRGKKLTEESLEALIQSQEKLCHNFGQKRKSIAIGVYRSDLMSYPIHFKGADPDKEKFVPLHMDEKLSLREIIKKHPKGVEYGHIVADLPLFPLLHDDNNEVLSFPPVINSAHLGAVEEGDENLFFDFSGTILDDLILAANILAIDCADMGYEVLPVLCKYSYDTPYGKEFAVPFYFQKEATCEVPFLQKMVGKDLTDKEIIQALTRMGISSKVENNTIKARVPEYRNDFLHPVDIVEDVMIGHGMENFIPEMPKDLTIGHLTEVEVFSRKIKDVMIGLGFQEMMYNYLGSKKEYIDNMHVSGESYIEIANPMSENYAFVRPSIIPSLLESESVSGYAVYPHHIFEVGKVAFKDDSDVSGTTTRNYLGFLSSSGEMGFNQLNSQIATLFYYIQKEYTLKEMVDPRFIEGRSGNIIYKDVAVGVFGEVSPVVLESWGITMPTVACEIDLDLLLAL